jgi:hypothetical protein
VFIGSSVEGLPIANAIQQNLQRDAFCDVWTQGIFGLGQTTIDALLNAVTDHDFGVFVLSPDDVQVIRNNAYAAPRDNVVFEAALFMGRYARDRAYLVKPIRVQDFRIPTDLLGLTVAEYDPAHLAINAVAAIGPASNQIRAAIHANQSYNRNLTFNISPDRGGKTYPLKLWLQLRNLTGVDVVIKSHYFLCNGVLRPALKAKGNPGTGEYEMKLPDRQNNLSLFDYLLVSGDNVTTWFPLDDTHTDTEVRDAITKSQSGEFHFTCYWLGPTPSSRRYARRV